MIDREPSAAELDELHALLDDPSLWEEPRADLEDRVVAAVVNTANSPWFVSSESANHGELALALGQPTAAAAHGRRPRLARRFAAIGVAVSAAAAILAGVVVGHQGGPTPALEAALRSPGVTQTVRGHAIFTKTGAGWRIDLDATGLPRLDGGRYYEAWLRNDGGVLVPVGTFNVPDAVVLWAGVSPHGFRTLTVTEEAADGNQASSGQRVLVGSAVPGN